MNTALIAGASGAVGSALARELASHAHWRVVGIARRPPAHEVDGVEYLAVDMSDSDGCLRALAQQNTVTHLFYCARATHAEQLLEDVPGNMRLLNNVLDAVEAASGDTLQHVHLVQGGKVYGVHVGPFPSPAREDAARAPIENFNYDQQDRLEARAASASWSWSASRPNTLLHFSPAIARNLVSTLGAYAAICRELGAALEFPGPRGAYESLTQVTSIELLARGMRWMASEPGCANQAFNLVNTDVFRWQSLWPKLAAAFDMPVGGVRPLQLAHTMGEREAAWQRIVRQQGLREIGLSQVANWGYADATLMRYWDEILSHNKARAHGFHDWDDSEARFLALLAQYRAARILP